MRPISAKKVYELFKEGDDLPRASLKKALKVQIDFLKNNERFSTFHFGKRTIPRDQYLTGLKYFLVLLNRHKEPKALWSSIAKSFDFYQVYGRKQWGDVFLTSYYEPVIEGRRHPTGRFTQALYKRPKDLVEIKLSRWQEMIPKDSPEVLWGKWIPQTQTIVPYHSREEIDGKDPPLRGRRSRWAMVDPLDSFFLQIQGSGTVRFKNGKTLRLGYDGQNGHPYRAIGKYLLDVIPLKEMTLGTIEAHLRRLPRKEQQDLLNKNPSYVFFKKLEQHAVTSMGVPATAGRTIATDARFFPKGGLALLAFEKPTFNSPNHKTPKDWKPVARWVLDQDVGGAIKGGGRVDLFWGRGKVAKQHAGVIKGAGKLIYLAPKETFFKKESPLASIWNHEKIAHSLKSSPNPEHKDEKF